MKINEFFEKEYLVAGNTYDNFIFENCPNEFLEFAKTRLVKGGGEVKSCVVCLNKQTEKLVEQTLNNFNEDLQKKILARDFITAVVIKNLLNDNQNLELYNFACQQIDAFKNNDFDGVKSMHAQSFMPHDVAKIAKDIGKIELTFILENTENKLLQQAINIFISSREPYSVKVFTNKERLSTYYDLNGNLIECPHDFMRRDVNEFVEKENDIERE